MFAFPPPSIFPIVHVLSNRWRYVPKHRPPYAVSLQRTVLEYSYLKNPVFYQFAVRILFFTRVRSAHVRAIWTHLGASNFNLCRHLVVAVETRPITTTSPATWRTSMLLASLPIRNVQGRLFPPSVFLRDPRCSVRSFLTPRSCFPPFRRL